MEGSQENDRILPKYGFGGRLSALFPSQVIVDVTEVCNLACVHCPHPEFKQSSHYQGAFLDPALNSRMVQEVRDHGAGRTQYIRYTSMGEPLVHPRIYDMLDEAVAHSGTYVTLTTNGTTLVEKRIRRLLDAGVHMLDVSIDAFTAETYARIRRGGNLAVTAANVRNLIEWVRKSGSPTQIVVSFVSQPGNAGEVEDFQRYWREAGASAVVIRPIHSAAGAMPRMVEQLRRDSMQRRPCVYPWERIVLSPRGFLGFCPADWTHQGSFVDYRNTSIAEVWQGSFYQALRQAHGANQFAGFDFCGNCPDWALTRWPNEGRAYADLISDLKMDSCPPKEET